MKANEFVKKFGLAKARKLVQGYPNTTTYKFYNYDFEKEDGEHDEVYLVDIKRLVESRELVKEHGTIERAKEYANSPYTAPEVKERLKQAIADVESCMEVNQ